MPRQVAVSARWLTALIDDRIPTRGVADPFGGASNRWSPDHDLDWLVRETAEGSVKWSRASQGGFKAGGRCPDASEMWVTLVCCGNHYGVVERLRRRMCAAPVRLWRQLEGRL